MLFLHSIERSVCFKEIYTVSAEYRSMFSSRPDFDWSL